MYDLYFAWYILFIYFFDVHYNGTINYVLRVASNPREISY